MHLGEQSICGDLPSFTLGNWALERAREGGVVLGVDVLFRGRSCSGPGPGRGSALASTMVCPLPMARPSSSMLTSIAA